MPVAVSRRPARRRARQPGRARSPSTCPGRPTADVLDHVDFGDTASETAHGIQASSSSGTSTEAGLTRRYSNSAVPGSWFSATVDVPAGEPFVLRGVETFDKAVTKDYDVYVDDVLVHTQLVPRTEGGQGIKVYDAVIDHPSLAGNDGNVRIRFEFPATAPARATRRSRTCGSSRCPTTPRRPTSRPPSPAARRAATGGSAPTCASGSTRSTTATTRRSPRPVSAPASTPAGRTTSARSRSPARAGTAVLPGERRRGQRLRHAHASRSASTPLRRRTELSVTTERGRRRGGPGALAFTATDAVSGVAATRYRVDGGPGRPRQSSRSRSRGSVTTRSSTPRPTSPATPRWCARRS